MSSKRITNVITLVIAFSDTSSRRSVSQLLVFFQHVDVDVFFCDYLIQVGFLHQPSQQDSQNDNLYKKQPDIVTEMNTEQ